MILIINLALLAWLLNRLNHAANKWLIAVPLLLLLLVNLPIYAGHSLHFWLQGWFGNISLLSVLLATHFALNAGRLPQQKTSSEFEKLSLWSFLAALFVLSFISLQGYVMPLWWLNEQAIALLVGLMMLFSVWLTHWRNLLLLAAVMVVALLGATPLIHLLIDASLGLFAMVMLFIYLLRWLWSYFAVVR